MRSATVLVHVLAAAVGCTLVCSGVAQADPVNPVIAIYTDIKTKEGQVQYPISHLTHNVGTFDCASQDWVGPRTTVRTVPGKPVNQTIYPSVNVNAVSVKLAFMVKNRKPGALTFTMNGQTVTAGATQLRAEYNLDQFAGRVNFAIHCGDVDYADSFDLVRPHVIGAGAFTIPAVPMAVLYEPPMDEAKLNKATYAATKVVGSTVRIGFDTSMTTTVPGVPSDFEHNAFLKDFVNITGQAVGNVNAAVGVVLSAIGTGLGSATATDTTQQQSSHEYSVVLRAKSTSSFTTGEKLGPGPGDQIIFLQDAKMVWVGGKGRPRVALLGHKKLANHSVRVLQEDLAAIGTTAALGPASGLDSAALQALLGLDPFAGGGPTANLDSNRYAWVDAYALSGGTETHTFQYDATGTTSNATATYHSHVEDYQSGFLSFADIGVTQNQRLTSVLTYSNASSVTSGASDAVSVELHPNPKGAYTIIVFYDLVFGTFAYKLEGAGSPKLQGKASDKMGRPLSNQLVSIIAGTRRYTVRTDANGNYSFASASIPDGAATLHVDGQVSPVTLKPLGLSPRPLPLPSPVPIPKRDPLPTRTR